VVARIRPLDGDQRPPVAFSSDGIPTYGGLDGLGWRRESSEPGHVALRTFEQRNPIIGHASERSNRRLLRKGRRSGVQTARDSAKEAPGGLQPAQEVVKAESKPKPPSRLSENPVAFQPREGLLKR